MTKLESSYNTHKFTSQSPSLSDQIFIKLNDEMDIEIFDRINETTFTCTINKTKLDSIITQVLSEFDIERE